MTVLQEKILRVFRERFGGSPILVQSPGRINLIGEHVDYNGGFVMPGAVDKHFIFAATVNDTGKCRICSADLGEQSEFGLDELRPGPKWFNYFMGVLDGFQKRQKVLRGLDCVFGGTIPPGGGLSSSAALCCGFGFAINELTNSSLSRLDLALVAQRAEHEFAGVMCGIMDQYASLFGQADSLLLLDCRSNTHDVVPFPSEKCTVILADTKVKHFLTSSAYNDRRASCEEGVAKLRQRHPEIQSLRDVSLEMLSKGQSLLTADVYRRCHYIVTEMQRTQQASASLRAGNLNEVGKMMFETHEGLRTEYEVSCEELDVLEGTARKHPELVIGARMMGGGFGGCTINLVRPGASENFRSLVSMEYFASFRNVPEFYTMTLAQGTHRVAS